MEECIVRSLKEWFEVKVYIVLKGEFVVWFVRVGDVVIFCCSNYSCVIVVEVLYWVGLKVVIVWVGLLVIVEI